MIKTDYKHFYFLANEGAIVIVGNPVQHATGPSPQPQD